MRQPLWWFVCPKQLSWGLFLGLLFPQRGEPVKGCRSWMFLKRLWGPAPPPHEGSWANGRIFIKLAPGKHELLQPQEFPEVHGEIPIFLKGLWSPGNRISLYLINIRTYIHTRVYVPVFSLSWERNKRKKKKKLHAFCFSPYLCAPAEQWKWTLSQAGWKMKPEKMNLSSHIHSATHRHQWVCLRSRRLLKPTGSCSAWNSCLQSGVKAPINIAAVDLTLPLSLRLPLRSGSWVKPVIDGLNWTGAGVIRDRSSYS